jgi:twitching motility protein PilU
VEQSQSKEQMHRLLQLVNDKNASDLFITVGFPPAVKLNGELRVVGSHKLEGDEVTALLESINTSAQRESFDLLT